jgi:hypothetical protein
MELGAYTAYEVPHSTTQLITLRRNITTVMEANKEEVRIGSNIPHNQICTVEVDVPSERQILEYRSFMPVLTQEFGNVDAMSRWPDRSR